MKKIFLSLAAIAALASCVEENTLEPQPQQPVGDQVTIKAVSADTKTLLDGTDVVWENGDQIKVVYQNYDQNADFSMKESGEEGTAYFTGTVNSEWTLAETYHPYAVYPATAVTEEEGTVNAVISHTLPEVQNGTVTCGMNLSSAILSESDISDGEAEAVFHNALTLLKIIVPEGVASVELSAGYGLVGTATFNIDDHDTQGPPTGEYDENDNPIYSTVYATGKLTIKSYSTKKTVTLSNNGDALAAGTHYVLVFPGSTNQLTLNLLGTDGAKMQATLSYVTFKASEYRTIDLTSIFKMETAEEMFIDQNGGSCPVKIFTTECYEYDVKFSDYTGNWLEYTIPTKGFHGEAIEFIAEENTTGADRSAIVTISWTDVNENARTRTFKITQKSVYMDFVNDENGDPIQWEETFGLYSDESLSTQLTTFTNVFTIEISDNYTNGTYIIKNLFRVDKYTDANLQLVPDKGGQYYANFNVEKSELTVLKANSVSGYTFSGDVVLVYDSANKTFSAETLTATLLNGSTYYNYGATRYIGNYSAVVKDDEPADGGDEENDANSMVDQLIGKNWKQTNNGASMVYNNNMVTFTKIDDNHVKINNLFDYVTIDSAVLDSSSKTLTVAEGWSHPYAAPSITNPELVFQISDDYRTMTLSGKIEFAGYMSVTDYTLTKQ